MHFKDQLFPVLSNQKYNGYLKEIGDMCNINKEFKTHMASKTFGTTGTLANNVPLESIKEMMGHKSLRQTMHYAKVTGIKVNEDMANLKKRLEKTSS